MANEVSIELSVETQQAIQALSKFSKQTDDTSKKATKGFSIMDGALASFAGNLAATAASKAFSMMASGISNIVSAVGDLTDAASLQEDAINDLNSALVRGGEYSAETSLELQKFASELQKVTKYGDEAILSQMAFAQSMGATAEQSKEILRAATDMAASLNIDLNSAVRNVSKTLGGYAGELGEVIPELKGLTQAQLQAGAAIDLIAGKFAGAAGSQIQTFSGATAQLSNAFGDLKESLGLTITQSPTAIAALSGLMKGITYLDNLVKENSDAIRNFAEQILTKSLTGGIEMAGKAISGFNGLIVDTKNFMAFLVDVSLAGLQSVQEFSAGVVGAVSSVKDFFGIAKGETEALQASLEKNAEITRLAREENMIEVNERMAQQDMVVAKTEEVTGRINELILQEIENKKTASSELIKIEQTKSNAIAKIEAKAAADKKKRDEESYFFAKKFEDRTHKEKVEGVKGSLGTIATLQQSSNKELFAIGKVAALADHGVNSAKAVSNALAAAPPPFNFILAGLVGVAMAVQGAKIAAAKPPSFATGGVVGGFNGASMGNDNRIATVRDGEMILTANEQKNVFDRLQSGDLGGNSDIVNRLLSQPIVVQIDGREIARANRTAIAEGFA